MKKCLGLLFGGLLLTTVASANSILINCGSAASANGVGSFSTVAITCPQFTLPAGDGLFDVKIFFQDGYVQGFPIGTNEFQFLYSSILAGLGVAGNTYTEDVTGNSGPITYKSTADWGGANGFYQIGGTINTGLAAFIGGGTYGVTSVSGSTVQGSLTNSGQLSVNVYVEYDYGAVPEPVTMVLVGGGLLGVGLLASKRRKKA